MSQTIKYLRSVINQKKWQILVGSVSFAVLAQLFQLLALMVRFGNTPNYSTTYNWIGNVVHVFRSTPSFMDSIVIAKEEWLLEIGYMNYDYGHGISEWSLNVIPSRLLALGLVGALLMLLYCLHQTRACSASTVENSRMLRRLSLGSAGVGALLMSTTAAAMSWVVCCATPSWVVGLAMLGLGVSTSLALEDKGPLLFYGGLALLMTAVVAMAYSQSANQGQSTEFGFQKTTLLEN